jgi:hypothetical protein
MAPSFLNSALDEGDWCASCVYRFTPRETAITVLFPRNWVEPSTSLGVMEKRFPASAGNRTTVLDL